ncbi:unnamed protein product [Heligmosomoides polygyrus]|uniref:2-(3-amino-3-carboxypropyl)histidine synthase subunit 2 n=1 Tax=Heligmosomoides polygyrus TaxID=6339 RepID=A0A183GGS7_HELPZ|nr:unnamed protein product [Heligmosomoides polygyrus]
MKKTIEEIEQLFHLVNVPKLSNFADIDVFILLSCPFGIMLDSSDYFRPVLSMFEAEIALNPSKTWFGDGKWCADFTQFIGDSIGAHENDGADVSLVTGKIRALNLPQKAAEDGQVVPYDSGDYFKNSTWRGLDDGVRLDEPTKVEEGRMGTALGYDTEPTKECN